MSPTQSGPAGLRATDDEEQPRPDITSLSPLMLDAIGAHLGKRLGEPLTSLETARKDVLSSSQQRTFHLVRARSRGERELRLHVRLTPWRFRQRDTNRLDAYLSERGMPVPAFFGVVKCDDLIATLWDHCESQPHRSFRSVSRDQINTIISSMAVISARSRDVCSHAATPVGARWIHPVAEEVRALLHEAGHGPGREALINHLAMGEDAVIQRVLSQDLWVLTHNDLVARNVALMEDGSVRLLDWDSASIAPPGASLRALSGGSAERVGEIAELYCREMRRHGLNTQVSDVIFMMRAQQAFWALGTGARRKNLDRVLKGLALFRASFPDIPAPAPGGIVAANPPHGAGLFPEPAPPAQPN